MSDVAAAYLSVNEVQDLAEQIGELKKLATAAGADLRIRVQLELDGSEPLTPDVIAKFNVVLQEISKNLHIAEAVAARVGDS